jgi:integrase
MDRRRQEQASNRTINLELMVLSRAIGYTWKALWPKLKKLEENRDVGRALEAEEEKRLLDAAADNPSKLIYIFLMVLAWTGMRSNEARTLRWSQVDFHPRPHANEPHGRITVGNSKTEAGTGRVIPMTAALRAALQHHAVYCAEKFGVLQPDWYLFPHSNTKKPVDPERPVTSLKTAWQTVRTEAAVICRLHDFRHTFCTKLAERGVPESTMLDMMGHVSAAMLRRYSHIRAKARGDAMIAVETGRLFGVPPESPTVAQSAQETRKANPLVS